MKNENSKSKKGKSNDISKMSLLSSREKPASQAKSLLSKNPEKGRRIRTVEVHSVKIEESEEKPTGETLIRR